LKKTMTANPNTMARTENGASTNVADHAQSPEQEGHGEEVAEVDDELPGRSLSRTRGDADDLRDESQPRAYARDAGEVEEKPAGDAEWQRHQADHPEQRAHRG